MQYTTLNQTTVWSSDAVYTARRGRQQHGLFHASVLAAVILKDHNAQDDSSNQAPTLYSSRGDYCAHKTTSSVAYVTPSRGPTMAILSFPYHPSLFPDGSGNTLDWRKDVANLLSWGQNLRSLRLSAPPRPRNSPWAFSLAAENRMG